MFFGLKVLSWSGRAPGTLGEVDHCARVCATGKREEAEEELEPEGEEELEPEPESEGEVELEEELEGLGLVLERIW